MLLSASCHDNLLRRVARSFALTIRLLPKNLQEPIGLAYLLARASDTMVDRGSLSPEASRQLLCLLQELLNQEQEGKEVQETLLSIEKRVNVVLTHFQGAENKLIALLPRLLRALYSEERAFDEHQAIVAVWQEIIEGQLRDLRWFLLERKKLLTPEERDRYLYLVAGSVGAFWTKLLHGYGYGFSQASPEVMKKWGVAYGKGLQLTNILRDRQEDVHSGRFYYQESEREELIEKAFSYLQQGELYVNALSSRRLRCATLLPLLLAKQTLVLIIKYPHKERVKVSRWKVYLTLLKVVIVSMI